MKKRCIIVLLACALFSLNCLAERAAPSVIQDDSPASVTIRVAGDFVIHSGVFNSAIKDGGGTPYFSEMLSPISFYLSQADFTITNVDGVMGSDAFLKKHPYSGTSVFHSDHRKRTSHLQSEHYRKTRDPKSHRP